VLAAYGYEALSRRLEQQEHAGVRRTCDRILLALGVIALAGGVGVWLYTGGVEAALPGIGTYTLLQLGKGLGLLVVAALAVAVMTWVLEDKVPPGRMAWGKLLLIGLLTADLFVFAHHFLPAVPAKFLHAPSRALDTIRRDTSLYRMTSLIGQDKHGFDRMPPNLPMAFGFQDLQGSDSLIFKGYTDLWDIIPKDTAGNPMADSPLLDLLNCKYLLTSLDLSKTPGWRRLTNDEVGVWENTEVLPRAWVPAAFEAAPLDQQLAKMSKGLDPRKVAYVDPEWWREFFAEGPGLPGAPSRARTAGFRPLQVHSDNPNMVTVSGFNSDEKFVLSDMWFPGWFADSPALLGRANSIMRASAPERETQVHFVYHPSSFAVGAFVSCLCVMLIACGLVMGRRRG